MTTRILRAHHLVAKADLAMLSGRPDEALHGLVQAELEVLRLDSPLIAYEAARVRSRALSALGEMGPARVQARYALSLAIEQQWEYRAAWVRSEFGLVEPPPAAAAAPARQPVLEDTRPSRGAQASGGDDALNRRRLAALQQVSLAAATVLDPRELAKVALDETVRILGAERAFLFLIDADLDQLVPHLGRDSDGNDIEELTGYGSTLVERVRQSGEPLVVTGSEEGVALGSRSAQVHGLRSIMVAPLLFDRRLLGIVYLDSRIAKGMFTADDVDILTAITNHVAMSLETARAAQLAVAVQAARRQRDVAETLLAAMAEQSRTLDPDEVMRSLLGSLARTAGRRRGGPAHLGRPPPAGGLLRARRRGRPRHHARPPSPTNCGAWTGPGSARSPRAPRARSARWSAAPAAGWRSRSPSAGIRWASCWSVPTGATSCRRGRSSWPPRSPVRA